MNSGRKKVLILTYRYPPYSGIGAVRMTSLSKYLREHGWEPFVYTCDWREENCEKFDANYANEVKEFVIHRASRISTTLGKMANRSPRLSRLDLVATEIRNRRRWVRAGRKNIGDWIEKHSGFDAIVATYPVMQALGLGNWISKRFGIPWIADMRDIVEENLGKFVWFAKQMELNACQSSSAITTVSEPLAAIIRNRYRQPVHVIPNGFDAPDSLDEEARETSPQTHFEILYTGLLYPPGHPAREGPGLIFDALDNLARAGSVNLDDFKIQLVGTKQSKVEQHFAGRDSEKCVVIKEWLSRDQIRKLQVNATLLLSLGSRSMQGILTGKVFEYLNAGRPILSIPSDREGIGKILRETGAGETAENAGEVANCIEKLYKQWIPDRSLPEIPGTKAIDQYNWRNQAGNFANVLNEVVENR